MKVLIVDNKSAHLARLKQLILHKLGPAKFKLLDPREVKNKDLKAADLVVISGGWGRSIVKNPQTFKRVIDMLASERKPTIGICLGAEAIAAAYGAELIEMPVRRVGNVRIYLGKELSQAMAEDSIMAYEFHKWKIKELPSPLKALADSKDGVEILRHCTLPLWGVQFHPEVLRLDNKGHLIFEHILEELKLSQGKFDPTNPEHTAHAIISR